MSSPLRRARTAAIDLAWAVAGLALLGVGWLAWVLLIGRKG